MNNLNFTIRVEYITHFYLHCIYSSHAGINGSRYSCLCADGFQLQADGRTCRKISLATNSSISFKNSSSIPPTNSSRISSPTNSSILFSKNDSRCNVNMGDIPCNYSSPVSTCVKRHQICDGTIDCRNGKDESAELCAGTSKCFY